ncbi:MAG: lactate utilization protein [Synergistaceae bacterium]|jgi:hypothetical protein|nr:lactate utilization protein [Synergistaceae bacterium]
MDVRNVTEALRKNGYEVSYFDRGEDAAVYLDESIDGKTVGFGDSCTLLALGIYERLNRHNEVYSPMHPAGGQSFFDAAALCLSTRVFLTSVNAVAETGELVNIDGTGNRVAGSLFGHEKVYFVVGRNKIEPTLEKAIWRARNVAAPQNAARHGFKTPCAAGGECRDCASPQRICNAMIIHYKKMRHIAMEVVLIGESLGL